MIFVLGAFWFVIMLSVVSVLHDETRIDGDEKLALAVFWPLVLIFLVGTGAYKLVCRTLN